MTAVECLLNEISLTTILDKEDIKLFTQSKEMEKQQIIDAYDKAEGKIIGKDKQYYNETFKNK